MQTQGSGPHPHRTTVGRGDPAVPGDGDGTLDDLVGVGEDRVVPRAGDEGAVAHVGAVGERFPHRGEAGVVRRDEQSGPGEPQHRQPVTGEEYARHHGGGLLGVADAPVVEGAVRLHVGDAGAGGAGEEVEGADLVGDLGGEFVRRHVHGAASEPGQVPVGDLGADGDAPGRGEFADAAHGQRVAGVIPAGDVGAGDAAQKGLVVGQAPVAEPLTEVGVEVDHRPVHHWKTRGSSNDRARSALRPAGALSAA